jgi:hypothetical protein
MSSTNVPLPLLALGLTARIIDLEPEVILVQIPRPFPLSDSSIS